MCSILLSYCKYIYIVISSHLLSLLLLCRRDFVCIWRNVNFVNVNKSLMKLGNLEKWALKSKGDISVVCWWMFIKLIAMPVNSTKYPFFKSVYPCHLPAWMRMINDYSYETNCMYYALISNYPMRKLSLCHVITNRRTFFA
jgi:hypothetical protein